MAEKAGIYEALWRPYRLKENYDPSVEKDYNLEYMFEEDNPSYAREIIDILTEGLKRLKEKPDYFKTFTPKNNWGRYEVLVIFVEQYLEACKKYPDALIETSR